MPCSIIGLCPRTLRVVGGCRYKDDPTIMAWDLINEPRCYKCGTKIQVTLHLTGLTHVPESIVFLVGLLVLPGQAMAGQGWAGLCDWFLLVSSGFCSGCCEDWN